MSNFNAEILSGTNGQKIGVSADTSWSCSVHGNFSVDKTYGSGDSIINISTKSDIPYGQGTILFSYGNEHCRQVEIPVYFNNVCYIETYPPFNDERKIIFCFDRIGQIFNVDFYTNNEISVSGSGNVSFFESSNSIMLYPTDVSGGEVKVGIGSDECGDITIILKNKNEQSS